MLCFLLRTSKQRSSYWWRSCSGMMYCCYKYGLRDTSLRKWKDLCLISGLASPLNSSEWIDACICSILCNNRNRDIEFSKSPETKIGNWNKQMIARIDKLPWILGSVNLFLPVFSPAMTIFNRTLFLSCSNKNPKLLVLLLRYFPANDRKKKKQNQTHEIPNRNLKTLAF